VKRFKKIGWISLLVFIILIVVARIMLKPFVLKKVNTTLQQIKGHTGSVDDISIKLYRGAYQIHNIQIQTKENEKLTPLFKAQLIDLSIEWKEVFNGNLVGEVALNTGEVNFVKQGETVYTGEEGNWQETIQDLFPLKINNFEFNNSIVHYRDFSSTPQVNIYIADINGQATNLTNSLELSKDLVSNINAKGKVMDQATISLNMDVNPYDEAGTFNLDLKMDGLEITRLNDFLEAYLSIDAEEGTFSFYTEMASNEGDFTGYLKPIINDLKILDWQNENDTFFNTAWQAIAGLLVKGVENFKEDQVGTQIPISGKLSDPDLKILTAIGNLLENAFIEALNQNINNTININSPIEEKEEEKKGFLKKIFGGDKK